MRPSQTNAGIQDAMNLTLEQYQALNPRCEIAHNGARMTFITPNVFTKWRVETIHSKEPCTLEWIAGFNAEDVLVDVGANVGMYSVWAAATPARPCVRIRAGVAKLCTAQPEHPRQPTAGQDQGLLPRPVQTGGRCRSFLSELIPGGSNHSAGQPLDYALAPMKVAYEQGCLIHRLDDLVASRAVPVPNHIKIDVDGFEHKVIAGAAEVLKNPTVKSLLIEVNLNLDAHRQMLDALAKLGFKYNPEQVRRAMRRRAPFKGVAEHVLKR